MATPRIISDPKILGGKPVIAGTRISVELILEEIGAGASVDDLIREYPHLQREQILEAVRYAAQAIRTDTFYPLAPVLT